MPSRNPFDPEDTDWGQKVERRHRENIERIGTLEQRMGSLEGSFEKLDGTLRQHMADEEQVLLANGTAMRGLKADITTVLGLVRNIDAMRSLGKLFIFFGHLAVAAVAIVAMYLYFTGHGPLPPLH